MKAVPFCSLLGLCLFSGCSEGEGAAKLAGAVHPTIPVFEPSDLLSTESFGFSAGDDFSDLTGYDAIIWELSSPRPFAELSEFYQRVAPPLPTGDDEFSFEEEEDESEAVFTMFPEGVDGEVEIEITVQRQLVDGVTRFSIVESVPASRR